MMSDKDNNLLKSDILTVGSELSEKLNAIGVPNTFGKASEGKDNLMSIIRMAINGIDVTIEQITEILKDYYNKSEVNTLLNGKSDTSHNHDSAYANISHNHDSAYASKSHQHDGADVILSNSNDVDSEIGTIEDDITSINSDITSLNNSITNLVQIYFISIDFGSVANGQTSTKTATVPSIPNNYMYLIFPKTTGWGFVSSSSISGTTLSVTMGNNSGATHTLGCGLYIVYYPISWKKY